jgi:Carboxypeptidase regulatory-like domain/TonB dependent receptor-like, beta-barrel/TonB-dependent Receptor Plug Domain
MKRAVWRGVVLFVSLVLVSTPVVAQVLYGSIVGTVTDESNLAVPGATVTITHAETNQARETTSNETGNYNFPNVAVGTYLVQVTLPGFQTFQSRDIVVRLNAAVRVDARLTVGALQESVQVSAQSVLLQTETAAVQTQTTSQQLQNLPINGRSFQSMLTLTPGVAQPNYFQTGGINNPARSMQVTVNGAPNSNTVFRLDGVSATNQWIQGLQAYTPAIEAIESVNVVTNSFDAEQGMAGGASVNVQIKSGTNALHGSAFEYFSHAGLRSRNYFLPADQDKTKDTKNVFGGTVGGPIKRDKVFYFVSLENTMQRAIGGPYVTQATGSASQFLSIPTAAIRSGNFSGTGSVIYDPATGNSLGQNRVPFAFANCGITSTADPRFDSCNFIPAARLNQVSKNILSHLPLPQLPGNANNYFAVPKFNTDFYKLDSKVSWNATNRLNMNGRLSYLPESELAGGLYGDDGGVNPLAVGTLLDSNISSAAVSVTHITSATFVVDGLFGFTRQHTYQQPPGDPNTCWGSVVGIVNACQPPLQRDWVMPRVDIALPSWSSYGNGIRVNDNTGSVFDYLDPQWQWVVNAGWNKGVHNVKFGFDVHRLHMNHYEITAPSFTFTGGATALNATGAAAPTFLNGYADFLLGLPITRNTALQNPLLNEDNGDNEQSATLRSWEYGVYVRDQFQLTRNLTVSAGVRWEYYPVPVHADRGVEVFDFTTNRLMMCGLGSNPIDCGVKVQKDLFTPRVGLAYRAGESMVFRAGYSRNPQNDNMIGGRMRNFPVNVQINDVAVGGNNFTPVGSFSDGYPLLPILNLNQPTLEVPAGVNIQTNEVGDYKRGVISTFNVSAQKVLPYSLTAQIGYVGNRQNGMARTQNLNYSQIGGGNASLPFNQPGLAGGFRTTAQVSTVRPLGRVKYDSLQASLIRRMTNGLGMTGAYTYAHATDWWAGGILIPEYWSLNKGTQNGNNRHKVDISATYELPFGQGKKYASSPSFASTLLSDWQVNTYFTAFTGSPFTVTAAAASLNANSPQVADQVKSDVEITHDVGPSVSWFDPTAFKPVTEARFGTAGFNTMRGPAYANVDLSVFRTFPVKNSMTVQFRLEIFNLTNSAHFVNPAGAIQNVSYNADGTIRALNGFGSITGTNNVGREYDERYMRLGVRFSF